MKSKSAALPIIGLIAMWLVTPVIGFGQSSHVDEGIAWLKAQRDSEGFWDRGTPYWIRTTALALYAVGLHDAGFDPSESMMVASSRAGFASQEHRARVNLVLGPRGLARAADIQAFVATQGQDGGWGYQAGYQSNVLDTALILQALAFSDSPPVATITNAVNYLASQKHVDNGWGFGSGNASSTFITTQVLLALHASNVFLDSSALIQDGSRWLLASENPDGGFGDNVISSPWETGLACEALSKSHPQSPELSGAISYLENSQDVDGSWGQDSYSTAQALIGLSQDQADIAVFSGDILFSNATPTDNEVLVISAKIRNIGVQSASNFAVRVFDGSHEYQGSEDLPVLPISIGSAVIASLPAGADTTITVSWNTFGLGGDHAITVATDLDDHIKENSEVNNITPRSLHVYYPPDLLIEVTDIAFIPAYPQPSDNVTIAITVRNRGELSASGVTLQLYDGNPDSGGIPLLGPYTFPGAIAAGSQSTLNVNMGNYFDTEGGFLITAVTDVYGSIREVSETNNRAARTLWVGVRCEPHTVVSDLNLLGLPITPSEPVTSYSALAGIDNSLEIHGWDPVAQSWQSAFDLGSGPALGEEFAIGGMQGFFARTSAPGSATFCGTVTTTHGCVDLFPGLNLVSVSHPEACYSGYHFLDSITDCEEAHSWDAATQSWLTAIDTGGGVPAGNDFTVGPGAGYFVKVGTAGSWCTVDCDTVSALPDVTVVPASIYFTQNPISSGGTVGIYVSVANAGTVNAVQPRLDIFAGDPNAGGTRLIAFLVPETIAPGGASGYWGNNFTISGSGSVKIFAVVDMYNSMPELNEANNSAQKTLYFAAAVNVAAAPATGSGGTPIGAAEWGRPLSLSSQLGVSPPLPVIVASPSRQPNVQASASPVAKSPQAVTEIAEVMAANASSSAAGIFWTTNECADGRVDYGQTTALGSTVYEAGFCNVVHSVPLVGLAPSTVYYYRIVSGGLTDDNAGSYYSFTTSAAGAGIPGVVTGLVVDNVSASPMVDVLVWAELLHGEVASLPLAVKTDAAGRWLANLGNFKSASTGAVLPWVAGDQLAIRFARPGYSFGTLDAVLIGVSPQDLGTVSPTTWVSGTSDDIPVRPYLESNYPNPFNPSTTIEFGVSTPMPVDLAVFNVSGRRVATLVQEMRPAGRYRIVWLGRDEAGRQVASGLYFYRLVTPEFSETRKMLLVK